MPSKTTAYSAMVVQIYDFFHEKSKKMSQKFWKLKIMFVYLHCN